jgi:hypothetical protein
LALSIVWRAPNILINMALSSAYLNGTILFLNPTCVAIEHFPSWHYLGGCVIDQFHHFHRCHCTTESCYNWSGTAELRPTRRRYWYPSHWDNYLVLYFTRKGPLP